MKYRVKFTKEDEIKYIGHLDVMRLFQRAINRAKLPVAYSKGFNPHQLLSFANPLSLGMTSGGEYGDFEMAKDIEPNEIVEGLNSVLPDGIVVLETIRLKDKVDNAMASVDGADYVVELDSSVTSEMIEKYLPDFLSQKEILVMKKTKNNYKETDIRQDIYKIENISEGKSAKLFLFLAAGSRRNVKAELVVSSLYHFMGAEFNRFKIRYKRAELYRIENGNFVKLNEGVSAEKF